MFISKNDFDLMVKTIDDQNKALKKAVGLLEDAIHLHHGMQKQIDILVKENVKLRTMCSDIDFPNSEERRSNG